MRRVIVVVVGLALVLIGLDIAARAAAQTALARQLQASEGLQQRPSVTVHGVPFLWQVVTGDYERVDTRLRQVPTDDELRLDSVDVRLTGVHLPLTALLGSEVTQIPLDAVQVTGRTAFEALETQVNAEIPNGLATVEIGYGGTDRLAVNVTYTGLGGPVKVAGTAVLSISRGELILTLPEGSLTAIPDLLRPTVSRLLAQTVSMQQLPFGLTPTRISVTRHGVTVTATADDVMLPTDSSTVKSEARQV